MSVYPAWVCGAGTFTDKEKAITKSWNSSTATQSLLFRPSQPEHKLRMITMSLFWRFGFYFKLSRAGLGITFDLRKPKYNVELRQKVRAGHQTVFSSLYRRPKLANQKESRIKAHLIHQVGSSRKSFNQECIPHHQGDACKEGWEWGPECSMFSLKPNRATYLEVWGQLCK